MMVMCGDGDVSMGTFGVGDVLMVMSGDGDVC